MDRATASILAVGVSSTLTWPTILSNLSLSFILENIMFKNISAFILINCAMYLFGSFYSTTFNIDQWSEICRFVVVLCSMACFVCYLLIKLFSDNKSEE